jgi:hypothetical protein
VRSFTSYVSAYDSHVGTLSIGDLPRDQQDDLIRRVFDGDFDEYVMEHDIDHAYPNALWTLIVLAGTYLERTGVIENFEHRTDHDRDQILNYFAPSKLWLRLEEAFPPFDQINRKSDYEWGELLLFAKRDAIAELQEFDWRTKLRNYTERDAMMITRMPYQTFFNEYDRGRLSLFVDRGLATQAYRLSGSPLATILPLVFFGGLLAFIPVAIFWSVWAGVGLFALAIIAKKMLTAKAVAWVRKEAIGNRKRYRWLTARGAIWARRI